MFVQPLKICSRCANEHKLDSMYHEPLTTVYTETGLTDSSSMQMLAKSHSNILLMKNPAHPNDMLLFTCYSCANLKVHR